MTLGVVVSGQAEKRNLRRGAGGVTGGHNQNAKKNARKA